MSIITPSILTLLCIGFVLLLLAACLYLYKTILRLQKQQHNLITKLSQYQMVLKCLPTPWCSWIDGDTFIHTASSFKTLFRFDTAHPLRLSDFISMLGDTNRLLFERALRHILDFGGNFTLEIDIHDHTKHIEISGCCHEYSPINTDGQSNRLNQIVVLSVRDTTRQHAEAQKIDAQFKKQQDEINTLRIMTDIAPVALWYRNTKGRIHACNQAFAGVLETTVHRVIAENRELIDRYGEASTYELSRMALSRGAKTTIRSHVVIGGQRQYLEISETPVGDTAETVGYAIDITALEESEKELKLTIQSHQDILNHLSSPVAIYGPDTKMTFFNTCYVTMFNQNESWLNTQPTLADIIDDLRDRRKLQEYTDFRAHKQNRLRLFNTLLEPIHEIIHQPDGIICRVVIAPTPIGGLVYIFDNITETLLLERRYNTLTAVQKETIDHLYEGIIVFGTDYRLRLFNPAMETVWGISLSLSEETHINDILKLITAQFKSPKSSKTWRIKMLDVLSKRHPERQRLKLKKDKVLEYSYVPLPDGSHLLSFIDVSDTWRFEKSLQERNIALEHEDRLKSDFISHVSYELQSPINTISGFSEILMNQYFGSLNEKQLDYSKGISEAADRLTNLLNDMQDLASINAGKFTLDCQEITVDALLNSALVLIQNRANDHGLELVLDNKLDSMIVNLDARRIKHALFNLLSNAIKFTPSGGRITLRADHSSMENAIDLIVEDTGVGIKESEREQILKMFNQDHDEIPLPDEAERPHVLTPNQPTTESSPKKKTKATPVPVKETVATSDDHTETEHEETDIEAEVENGFGLSLTLVRQLIELHGGYVHLESEIDKGTHICCTLPIDKAV